MFGPFRRLSRRPASVAGPAAADRAGGAGAADAANEARNGAIDASVDAALARAAEGGCGAALSRLDEVELDRLRALAARFVAARRFEGAGGLEPDADLIARVAVEACLPVLNLPGGLDAYARARGVILYPSGFLVDQRWTDEDGIEHEREAELAGEAWDGGPVVLAADDVEAAEPGFSVVVHEFAHVLDAANGAVNGFPDVRDPALRAAWPGVFDAAYRDLVEAVERNERTPLDDYAAEDPAEFFAVATEAFFTDPVPLRERWPELYRALAGFYGQDPAARACRGAGRRAERRRGRDA